MCVLAQLNQEQVAEADLLPGLFYCILKVFVKSPLAAKPTYPSFDNNQ
jgi:hypothetical protein